ncbi:MAG: hypothetical protein SFY92_08895 [Verrucomicrobiae bacterium]|nr:hypothetical protein [Verrucomicrobiae bacterium]
MKTTPSPLDDIRIASPCGKDWEAMTGDDRVRHCEACTKNVYNLSAMSRADAEELIRRREGNLCVRLYRRADGRVLTADCPVGLARVRERIFKVGVACAAIVIVALGTALAVGTRGRPRQVQKWVKQTEVWVEETVCRVRVHFGWAPKPVPSRTLMGDVHVPTPAMGTPVLPPPTGP